MLIQRPQHDACWTCHKLIVIPEGYDPRHHKLVCSDLCMTVERLFTELWSHDTQHARCMHQEWVKSCGK